MEFTAFPATECGKELCSAAVYTRMLYYYNVNLY